MGHYTASMKRVHAYEVKFNQAEDMKLYKCKHCGATYTHDNACNHAVYECPRREGNKKPHSS